jgi:Uncharacterized conserved protein
MARSVVLKPSVRCERCRLPPRWCVCGAAESIVTPLAVDVLMHSREQWRPSSTGHLVCRAIEGARLHVWRRGERLRADEVRRAGRELWILHPAGEPMPAAAESANVQVLLLDGAWREATLMAQDVAGWGRRVRLPMAGESRYWLRTQQTGGRFSTVEALAFLLGALGLERARAKLELQLELHVYAGLRARGQVDLAEEFLRGSRLRDELPEFIARMNVRRPR